MEKPQDTYQGPMNAEWFYSHTHSFVSANKAHQLQQWKIAEELYTNKLLELAPEFFPKFFSALNTINVPTSNSQSDTSYDINMARLNLAACLMAQRKPTEHWQAFDVLLNIPESQRINGNETETNKVVLVRTDQIGIGDIFHFLSAASHLKNRSGWKIILSIPHFLQQTLASAAKEYGFTPISAEDDQPATDYQTHLISLLGLLKLPPHILNPEKVMFTAPERAINAVLEQVTSALEQGNIIVVADRGKVGRQATLIGGKQLPRNSSDHGRHLDSEPFNSLLRCHHNLTLMDCSNKNSRIIVDDEHKKRYLTIANEEQPFDTIIALARIMSAKKGIVGFGPDMGQSNVFARSLDHDAKNRMALVIPNAKEHDMRMEGEGAVYKQMISNCWVYKCPTPNDQIKVIEQAYQHMLKY